MGELIPLVAIVMVFGIPLSGIIGNYYLRVQKLKLQSGQTLGSADKKRLEALLEENEHLKRRVENLEEIVSDPDILKIAGNREHDLQRQIDFLAEELSRMKRLS